MGDYKHPEVLVSTSWAAEHSDDPKVRLVEVDVDTSAYEKGHIKNAVGWNWQTQLQDNVRRDLLGQKQFEELCSKSGISNDSAVVIYGDNAKEHPRWGKIRQNVVGYAEAIKTAGGNVEVIDLPDIGIKGNTHMMMMDKNSDQIAGVMQKWLVTKGFAE